MLFIEIIAFIALIIGLMYFATPAKFWTPILAVVLLALSFFSPLPVIVAIIFWLIFLPIAILANIAVLRQKLFTSPLLSYFQKSLPSISPTEKEAIEAGDIWWLSELFSGNPDWRKLADMPEPQLSVLEQDFLDNQVEKLCAMLDDWSIIQNHQLPEEVWDFLKQHNFFGLCIPVEYGGLGFSALAFSHIVTKISSRSPSVGITVMVPNSLGPAEFIHYFGTEEQKKLYLPKIARGEEITSFALTSPEAGSDAANIPDMGIVCRGDYEGREVLGIRLNWSKRHITLAPIATLMGLVFKLYDPDHLLGKQEQIGITICLVPTHLKGVEKGPRHYPAGLAFLNGPTRGKDVFVPLDFIIGGPEMRGKGWRMMMEALAIGRGISLPALSTAIAKVCYRMTGAYCSLREQFNTKIGQFEGIATRLARIGGLTYICEATRYLTLTAEAQNVRPALASAITKYHLTEIARIITNDAMDIHAGRGIQLGPRNYLASLYKSLPIGITVEGANILTRNLIIFGQGAIRCHPFIQKEIAALAEPDPKKRLQVFDQLIEKHSGYIVTLFARAWVYGITKGFFIETPVRGELGGYYRQLTRMSNALAFVANIVLVVLGGELKRKERMTARLGDVLSSLYMGTAVLKYFHNQKEPAEDLPFVRWSMQKLLHDIENSFREVFANFKPRWLARFMSWIIFPWGRNYHYAEDDTEQQMATMMMRSSIQRDRLTEFCYVGKDQHDITGRMELALSALEKARPARAKLHEAITQRHIKRNLTLYQQIAVAEQLGIFDQDELKAMQEFSVLRWDAIQVDEFDSLYAEGKTTAKKGNQL